MAEDSTKPDPALIAQLAETVDRFGLSEIAWHSGTEQLCIRKQAVVVPAAPVVSPAVAAAPAAAAPESSKNVRSPMIGIAYRRPQPGAEPFIKEGDRVEAGQTLLIIEAMKVMNQIPAPFSGVVKAIHVEDNNPVEFEQLLVSFE